jgi:hypothetical protein
VKEAGKVGSKDVGEVRFRVLGKRLGDEYPGVVDQRVDAAKAAQTLLDDL